MPNEIIAAFLLFYVYLIFDGFQCLFSSSRKNWDEPIANENRTSWGVWQAQRAQIQTRVSVDYKFTA